VNAIPSLTEDSNSDSDAIGGRIAIHQDAVPALGISDEPNYPWARRIYKLKQKLLSIV